MKEAEAFRAKADECEKKAEEAKDAKAKRVLHDAARTAASRCPGQLRSNKSVHEFGKALT